MTNEEAIKFLSQIMDALLASNSWLPSTDNPIKESFGMAINALTAQEQLANDSPELAKENGELISRAAAQTELMMKCERYTLARESHGMGHVEWSDELIDLSDAMDAIRDLPSAQPEQTNSWYINSWCNNCKEYDTENKCCPRYNRVIKQTLDDAYRHGETEAEARFHAQQRWIPCSERLPDEYGNYLISIKGEEPDIGTINPNDPRGWSLCDANGFYWANDKMLNIIAWMPLPEPYREEGD